MNHEAEKIKQEIENGNFIENNGRIMRMLDIMSGEFKKLTELKYVLSDLEEYEIVKSIDYLYESGYIKVRTADTKRSTTPADTPFNLLAVKLTNLGIQVLVGKKEDVCISL
ncbi:MAG: hypothetical protein NC320_08755 [Clostridium sp.]|nr:hypothetical protein [Clostridium sp.]